jgi:hypothetical protein
MSPATSPAEAKAEGTGPEHPRFRTDPEHPDMCRAAAKPPKQPKPKQAEAKPPKPGVVRRAMCILTGTGEVIPYPRLPLGPRGAVDLAALRTLEDQLVRQFGESDA